MHLAATPGAGGAAGPLRSIHRLSDDADQASETVGPDVGGRPLARHEIGEASLLGHDLNLDILLLQTHLLRVADQAANTRGPGAHREALGANHAEHKQAGDPHDNEGKNHDTHGQDSALRNAI